jgi:hypothetical protein
MQIPFVGQTYGGRSSNFDASRSINFFPEISQDSGSKSIVSLVGTPGTRRFSTFDDASIVRMSYTFANRCFVVADNDLYEIFDDGTHSVSLGTLYLSSDYGRISVTDNGITALGIGGNQMMMVADNHGYIFDVSDNTLTDITTSEIANFPLYPKFVAQLDGYFVVVDDSMGFYVSELYNGLLWPILARAAVISSPEPISTVVSMNQMLYFIKEYSTELFFDNATITSQGCPFSRVSGQIYAYGTSSPWSVAVGAGTVFFLANQGGTRGVGDFIGVAAIEGASPKIISTPPINYRISKFSNISDAFGYVYSDEGHTFYVLTFPSENATFCYDITTGMWHERSSYKTGYPSIINRHISNTYTYFGGKHLVGSYQSNVLLEMNSNVYSDDGYPIPSIRIAQPIFDKEEGREIVIDRLIIDCETGVGIQEVTTDWPGDSFVADGTLYANGSHYAHGWMWVNSPNADPHAWLSWSKDGGHTWSAEYSCSMGKTGEYGKRLVWRKVGVAKSKIFKLRMSNLVKKVVISATIEASK